MAAVAAVAARSFKYGIRVLPTVSAKMDIRLIQSLVVIARITCSSVPSGKTNPVKAMAESPAVPNATHVDTLEKMALTLNPPFAAKWL